MMGPTVAPRDAGAPTVTVPSSRSDPAPVGAPAPGASKAATGSIAAREGLLALAILVSLGWIGLRFVQTGYLPQPFFFRVDLSFMDFYEPAFWAHREGTYSAYHALYPPLSFDLLRLVTPARCYGTSGLAARTCDRSAALIFPLVFALNAALVYACYRRQDRRTAVPRAVALSLGLPMLYAMERGNLLLPCFTFLVLGLGPLLRSGPWRWLALAVSINFKPYLLMVIMPKLAGHRWRALCGLGLAALAVYATTYLVQGSGSPLQLLSDVGAYAGVKSDAMFSNLYYATSYWPLARWIEARQSFASGLSAAALTVIWWGFIAIIRSVQLLCALCLIYAALRPKGVDTYRFTALCTALVLTTVTNGSSGYVQIFLIFLVFFEPWRGPVRITILVSTYLLCIPFDLILWPVALPPAHSSLGGRDVAPHFGVSVGQLVRPGILLIIQAGLIVLNLRDSMAAGRAVAPLVIGVHRP